MNVASEKDLRCVGYICQCARQTVRAVGKAADALGIQPALQIDNVPYFNVDDCETLVKHFREGSAK